MTHPDEQVEETSSSEVEQRAQEMSTAIKAGRPFEAAVSTGLLQLTHGEDFERAVTDRTIELVEAFSPEEYTKKEVPKALIDMCGGSDNGITENKNDEDTPDISSDMPEMSEREDKETN